jgi:tetratricopeptide (TPR) repeat protein
LLLILLLSSGVCAGACGGSQPVQKTTVEKKKAPPKRPDPFATARTSLPACDALVDQTQSLISPGLGQRVRAALVKAAPSFGDEVAQRVLPALLQHAVRWATQSAQLCFRHVAQGALGRTEYEKRIACHGEAFARMRALANALQQADVEVAEWALAATVALDEGLEQCARARVWKGYDINPVVDATAVQGFADAAVFATLQKSRAAAESRRLAMAEARNGRSQLLEARSLVLTAPGRDQVVAEEMLERALALYNALGSGHGRMRVQQAAAQLYLGLDQPVDAITHVEAEIAICDEVHGKSSRTCGAARRRSSVVLARAGRGKQALQNARDALKTSLQAVGEDHPETLLSRVALASLAVQHGDRKLAAAQMEALLTHGPRTLGPNHPQVGDQLRLAGRVSLGLGDAAGAAAYLRQAVERHSAAHGDVHGRVAEDLLLLGRALERGGDQQGAATALDKALAIHSRLHAGAHPRVAEALKRAAMARVAMGKPPPKALQWLERAKAMDEELLGEDDEQIAIDLRLIGLYWSARGDHRQAYQLYLESVKRLTALHGPDHPETKRSVERLDQSVRAQGI